MIKPLIFAGKGEVQNSEGFLRNIRRIEGREKIFIQVFDAEMVCGELHLISSLDHAIRAWGRKRRATTSLEMETLLYSSGLRQISEAIKLMGVKEKKKAQVAFMMASIPEFGYSRRDLCQKDVDATLKTFYFKKDSALLECNDEKLSRYGLTQEEILAVPPEMKKDLVLEKIAMLDLFKT